MEPSGLPGQDLVKLILFPYPIPMYQKNKMFTFPFSELSNAEINAIYPKNYDVVDGEVYYNGHWYPCDEPFQLEFEE